MANRYWVGGTAAWDATAGTKWATSSGGAGGETVPAAGDDVFLDAASGANTVSINTNAATCRALNFTGFTGTLNGDTNLSVAGNVTLSSTMTWNLTTFVFVTTNTTWTSNGKSINPLVFEISNGATFTLADNFSTTKQFRIRGGTINLANFNLTCGMTERIGTNTTTITMGSGTWECIGASGENPWDLNGTTNLTLNGDTSTLKLTMDLSSPRTFAGGGDTYNSIWIAPSGGNESLTISGSNTFNNFKASPGAKIKFTDGTTQTVTTTTLVGTRTSLITLAGTSTGGWTLSDSTGTDTIKFCTISYSTASGGATFTSFLTYGNVDGGNNTGWDFGRRYWVGGTETWNSTAGSKWALTSGGAGGASAPTTTTSAFLDAASGNVEVTKDSGDFGALDCTGFTGTLTCSSTPSCNGNFILNAGMTFNWTGGINFYETPDCTCSLYDNTIVGNVGFGVASGSHLTNYVKLGTDFITQGSVSHTSGTFDANDFDFTFRDYTSYGYFVRTINMGSGTWLCTGDSSYLDWWNISYSPNLIINAETSTLQLTYSAGNQNFIFTGSYYTYNNIWIDRGASTGINTFKYGFTCNDFKDSGTEAHSDKFSDGDTFTVSSLTVAGSAGKLITLTGTGTAGWYLTDTTGSNTVDYCSVSYCIASGGATFSATHSTNGGGNFNWNFADIAKMTGYRVRAFAINEAGISYGSTVQTTTLADAQAGFLFNMI